MKNILLLLLFSTVLFFSCGKQDDKPSSQLPAKAETKPQFDNTSFGVYKGVIIGSSGFIIFRINNGDNLVRGYLTIDGKKDTLSTTQNLIAGQRLVDVKFTGRFSSMTLNADNDGGGAEINDIKIDGHPGNVACIIIHENSSQQVFCYEGSLIGGSQSGTFNFIKMEPAVGDTSDGLLMAIAKFSSDTLYMGYTFPVKNQINFNLYNFPSPRDTKFFIEGKSDNNNLNGTWDFSEVYGRGTFSCERTY